MPRPRKWSSSADELLRREYATTSVALLAARLNRSEDSVKARARILGLTPEVTSREPDPSPAERFIMRLQIHGEKGEWGVVAELLAAWQRETGAEPQRTAESPIAELGLPTRLVNALDSRGFYTAADLRDVSDEELRAIPNLGPQAVTQIRTQLAVHGLIGQALAATAEQRDGRPS